MSGRRYFQTDDGWITASGESPGAYNADRLASDPTLTEVQVVPLDAIVIRREELPEVATHAFRPWVYANLGAPLKTRVYGEFGGDPLTPAELRIVAKAFLALADHKEGDQPAEQVKATADRLSELHREYIAKDGDPSDAQEFARWVAPRLVTRGVRVEGV